MERYPFGFCFTIFCKVRNVSTKNINGAVDGNRTKKISKNKIQVINVVKDLYVYTDNAAVNKVQNFIDCFFLFLGRGMSGKTGL